MYILLGIAIFLKLIFWIVLIDVVISWLMIFGLRFRPQIIAGIIDPIYDFIKKHIPTTIGPLDFTPIFIIILVEILLTFIFNFDPKVHAYFSNLFN